MTKIKICGLFRPEDAEMANEALPDYIGFVFAESRRRVTRAQAERIRGLLNPFIKAAGVFVNAPIDEIASLYRDGVIDLVQLHGDEDEAYVSELRAKTDAPLIKAVRVQSVAMITDAQRFACDYLLLDTWRKGSYGGGGEAFDWTLIPPLQKPFFLAGGIDAGNIREAVMLKPYAVDVSSGVETDGIKDRDKIMKLVRIVRSEAI